MTANGRSPTYRPSMVGWVTLLGVALLLHWVTFWLAEGFWFQEVGYTTLLSARLLTQSVLAVLVFGVSFSFLWGNLAIATRYAPGVAIQQTLQQAGFSDGLGGHSEKRLLRLRGLLPLVLGLGLLIGLLLLYHGKIAAQYWQPDFGLTFIPDAVPVQFRLQGVWQLWQELPWKGWGVGALSILAIALVVYPHFCLRAIALLISGCFALILSNHWAIVLAAFYKTSFDRVDPIFQHDLSFFVFSLPMWELLKFWLIGLFVLAFCSISLVYLVANDSLSQGKFLGFSRGQYRHLLSVGGCLMLALSLSHWLDRYELLYSDRGAIYGASYTNVFADLPADSLLSLVALVIGAIALGSGLVSRKPDFSKPVLHSTRPALATRVGVVSSPQLRQWWKYAIALYGIVWAIATFVLPTMVQRAIVQPNELTLEQPYIVRNLDATRQAFNLEPITIETFNPQYALNREAIERNDLTIDNIRLWDARPLLETNRQLQRIRPYYEFPDADLDRYTLPAEGGETSQQQVLIAARELDYSAVPAEAQTWVNEHLIYTHGYGFTLSPVNSVGEGGLPDYMIQGIEQTVIDERVRGVIPTDNPQIYYGEMTNTYVMTATGVRELDYPSGSENVYNTYDGRGGVAIGAGWQRLLYAKHMGDWRIVLAENFTPQTRLLFHRQIMERVKAIAPFLRYDSDPYLVIANVDEPLSSPGTAAIPDIAKRHYLYWVIDAYTTSDRYPYSDPGNNDFNYIRNSVKVVVDAYHGSVNFYIADAADPLIQTWSRAFPNMFQPLDRLPTSLQSHIRYPEDLYRVQSEQLMVYHMTDPQVFYNREDQWRAPNEIYGDEQRLVEPYYLIMKLPTSSSEEFILFRPYAPEQRTNLVAWLAARSDGDNYGKLLLYRFPKQELVYGPEQLEARINQDPVISQQISLWNRRGSRALQGNLLVIPIERSLLYVEPLYIEAEQNRLPILARVIVAYGDRIVMAETLEQALEAVFQSTPTNTPAIIRLLEDEAEVPVP